MTAAANSQAPADVLTLSESELELQARARKFADEILQPLELEAAMNGGHLPAAALQQIREEA